MGVSGRLLAAGLAGGAVLLATGCAGGGANNNATASSSARAAAGGTVGSAAATRPEPAEAALITSMQQAVRTADSVHVTGRLTNAGVPLAVNLDLRRNGDMGGTISQNGVAFEIIGVSGNVFVKATPAFLRQVKAPANACAAVCGKWIQLQAHQARQLTGDIGMASMTSRLLTTRLPKFAEAGHTTVAGQAAWVLRGTSGATLDVSSTGSPYPLAAKTATNPTQDITYSRWNAVPRPTAPPANEVLNLKGIG